MRPVAALFVRKDSIYNGLAGVDCYDIERNALAWPGGCPGVFHPPCRAWGVLRQFALPRPDEKALALWAVEQVRRWGGVLEHPAGSTLWPEAGLPAPGQRDVWSGWTLPVHQHWWGHRAEKATRLYIVGCEPRDIPDVPLRLDRPTHCVRPTKSYPRLPSVTKREREATPPAFAEWLVSLARRCVVPAAIAVSATPALAADCPSTPAASKPAAQRKPARHVVKLHRTAHQRHTKGIKARASKAPAECRLSELPALLPSSGAGAPTARVEPVASSAAPETFADRAGRPGASLAAHVPAARRRERDGAASRLAARVGGARAVVSRDVCRRAGCAVDMGAGMSGETLRWLRDIN